MPPSAACRPHALLLGACLLGACFAARFARADGGLETKLEYIGEVISDVSGGARQGTTYDGLLRFALDADLGAGTKLHGSALQIHGYGPSEHYVGNLMTVSNIEATPATRLYALWLEKALAGGRASLRAGQLGADEEFLVSDTASTLINGTFGWAALAASDLMHGGPAYPLAVPGARLRMEGEKGDAWLIAAFAGNPSGPGCRNVAQRCNRHGTTFSTSGGTLWMSELQWPLDDGAAKLGGWYETRGNWGAYAIVDRALWRKLHAFVRFGGAPEKDNFVSFYVDAGLTYRGLLARRPQDTVALGVARAVLGRDAPSLDYESVIELSYVAPLTRQLTLQPDLQYVVHPGGSSTVPDATVVGLRAVFDF